MSRVTSITTIRDGSQGRNSLIHRKHFNKPVLTADNVKTLFYFKLRITVSIINDFETRNIAIVSTILRKT